MHIEEILADEAKSPTNTNVKKKYMPGSIAYKKINFRTEGLNDEELICYTIEYGYEQVIFLSFMENSQVLVETGNGSIENIHLSNFVFTVPKNSSKRVLSHGDLERENYIKSILTGWNI